MKTAVLLSGGVDSSVALRLLEERGESELTAFYLKIWLEDELSFLGECPWEEDLGHARAVCEQAGVPLEVVPLQREYHERVVSYALAELERGRTPSPDIFCNQRIKFGAFLEEAGQGFDRVATGHYARIRREDGLLWLDRGVDPVKDQTYFLSHLDQERLRHLSFPVGHLHKREVRELAARYHLPNRERKDSQGICFLGKIRFDEFLRSHFGERPGPIVDAESGRHLGEHRGYWFHTIGQRRGLGLSGGPWYVVGKDPRSNTIRVVHGDRRARHERRVILVTDEHWITRPPSSPRLRAKLRHGERLVGCRLDDAPGGGRCITLDEGDPGVAPGQFVVLYDGETCLGGARIV